MKVTKETWNYFLDLLASWLDPDDFLLGELVFARCSIREYQVTMEGDFAARLYLSLLQELDTNREILLVSFILSAVLCGLLSAVALLFSRDMVQETEKKSPYECGFFPFDSATRLPFDVHFYVVGIMFLVFDVELIVLTTAIILAGTLSGTALGAVAVFIIILTVGFVYEWNCGALRWESKIPEPVKLPLSSNATYISAVILLSVVDLSSCVDTVFSSVSLLLSFLITALLQFVAFSVVPVRKNRRARAVGNSKGRPWRRKFVALTQRILLYFNPPTVCKPGVYNWRRWQSVPESLAPSWRPRFWRKRVTYYQRIWDAPRWSKKKFRKLFDDILFSTGQWRGYHARYSPVKRLHFILRTKCVPFLHYHVARIHRWPLFVAISLFIIPVVCVPVPWFLDDYEVAWAALVKLYEGVHRGVTEHSEILRRYCHPWVAHIVAVPLLYPAAALNILCTYHWPFMLFVGFAVARCCYLYSYWTHPAAVYRHFRIVRRFRRWGRVSWRRYLGYECRDYYEAQKQVRIHPDKGQEDTFTRPFLTRLERDKLRDRRAAISKFFAESRLASASKKSAPLLLVVLLPATGLLDVPLLDTTITVGSPFVRFLHLNWNWITHDLFALCWSVNTYSRAVALTLLLCGIVHGFTGLFLPFLRYLMHPKARRWVMLPFLNALIFYLSIRGLVSWWEFNTFPRGRMWYIGWTTGVATKSWFWVISRPVLMSCVIFFIFYIKPTYRRSEVRYWSGRQSAAILRERHIRNVWNRRFLYRTQSTFFETNILDLISREEEFKNDKKYKGNR